MTERKVDKELIALISGIVIIAIIMIIALILFAPTKCKRTYSELITVAKQVSTELNQAPRKYREEYNWEIEMETLFSFFLSFDKTQELVNYKGDDAIYISISCADKCPLLLGGKKTWIEGNAGKTSDISNLGLKEEHGSKVNAYIARYYYDEQYYQVTVFWKNDKEKAMEILNRIIGLEIVK